MSKYVNNKEFYNLLLDYRENRTPKSYQKIGEIFLLIAQRFLNRSNFIKYTEDRKNEMISDATYYMCRYIDKYDLSRNNPFAYFTMVAKNAFLQYINEYKKRNKMFINVEFIDSCDRVSGGCGDNDFIVEEEEIIE